MNEVIQKEISLPAWNEPENLDEAQIRILDLGKNIHEHAYLVGKDLIWVKENVGHGNYETWIGNNVWFGPVTAWRFMAFADKCDGVGYLISYHPKKSIPKSFTVKDLPEGKYAVLYADPPWDIGSIVLEKWESPLDDKYPTMTLEKLKELKDEKERKVQDLSAEDCVCFMWTTLTVLPDALELLDAWGFKYHITLTWDKNGGWSSNGFFRKSELILVGYKGKLSNVIKQEGEYIPTVFFESKTSHSTKPQKMYEYIEERTMGKKIELFARNKRAGWDAWGNQL